MKVIDVLINVFKSFPEKFTLIEHHVRKTKETPQIKAYCHRKHYDIVECLHLIQQLPMQMMSSSYDSNIINIIAVNDMTLQNSDKLKGQFEQNQVQATL